MVAQDHRAVAAELGDEPRLLLGAEGEALVIVVGDVAPEAHRMLRQRQQAGLQRGHRDAGVGVQVDHAVGIGPGAMHRAVDGEAARVGGAAAAVDHPAVEVDHQQAGGGDLVEAEAEGVDQEGVGAAGQAQRQVGVDQVAPAVAGGEPVSGGEVDTGPPFGFVEALRAGDIAGAGLDVFETEPLPSGHPLWTMPGVFLTPHTAAYGPHLDERRYGIIRDNLAAMIEGGPLRNVVDKANWF